MSAAAMRSVRTLYHLARADFLERVRRHAFLVTIGFAIYAAYTFLPPNHARYATLQMAGHRGIYNSAYVGTLVAMMSNIFLTFAGFYVVKNAVDRDRRTGVGEILATTPIRKVTYTLAKALSNFAVLVTMVAVVALAAAGMQWVLGEDRHIDPLALFTPFVVITLPVMMTLAAVAVLFETVTWLRGGFGNVVFFFSWITGISMSAVTATKPSPFDSIGAGFVFPSMFRACEAAFHDFRPHIGAFSMGLNFKEKGTWDLTTFRWEGVHWSGEVIGSRAAWLLLAVAITLIAAIPFDRFDSTRAPAAAGAKRSRKKAGSSPVATDGGEPAERGSTGLAGHHLLEAPATRSFAFGAMLFAELRLMRKGLRMAWFWVAIGLAAGCAFAPLPAARGPFLAFAWIWPLLVWSSMGAREARDRTGPLLFSSPHPLHRQLPALWLAGVVVALLTGCGMGVRLALTGNGPAFFGWTVGALFIPSLALACGIWTGSGKLFEVIYLLLWYGGPLQRVPFLDFTGSTPGARTAHVPEVFAGVTLVLLALAWFGRSRRLRS